MPSFCFDNTAAVACSHAPGAMLQAGATYFLGHLNPRTVGLWYGYSVLVLITIQIKHMVTAHKGIKLLFITTITIPKGKGY